MKQWLKEFVHNCVVHPIMPFLPTGLANVLHDLNGKWAYSKLKNNITRVSMPNGAMLTGGQLVNMIDKAMAKSVDKPSMRDFEEWKNARIFAEAVKKQTAFDRNNQEHIKALRDFMEGFLQGYDENGKPVESLVMFKLSGKGQLNDNPVDMVGVDSTTEGFVFNLILPLQGI